MDSTCPKTPVYQISYFSPEVHSYVTYLSPYYMQWIIINFFKNCYRHWNSVYPINSNYRMLFRTIILHNVFLIISTYSPEGRGGVRIYNKFEIIRGGGGHHCKKLFSRMIQKFWLISIVCISYIRCRFWFQHVYEKLRIQVMRRAICHSVCWDSYYNFSMIHEFER